MKTNEELKKSMIMYVKDNISDFSNQLDEKEAMAFKHTIRGQIAMMHFTGLINKDEASNLYNELGKAGEKAEKNIYY